MVSRPPSSNGQRPMTRRHPRPVVTAALVGVTTIAFLAELAGGGMAVCDRWGLVPSRLLASGEVLPLFTYGLLHDPSGFLHVGGNLVVLALAGPVVERQIGALRLLVVYVCAAVLAGLLHVVAAPSATDALVGNSGCVCALAAIAVAIRPQFAGFAIGFLAWNLYADLTGAAGQVSAPCHLAGFAVGITYALIARARGALYPAAAAA